MLCPEKDIVSAIMELSLCERLLEGQERMCPRADVQGDIEVW